MPDLNLQAGKTNADIDHGRGANHTQDSGLGPKAGAGIPAVQTVTPLPEDSHLDIINDPTHQSTRTGSVHAPQTQGEDVNYIRFNIQAKFEIQFNMRWR